MKWKLLVFCALVVQGLSDEADTCRDPASRQLEEFAELVKKPIGVQTLSTGIPVDVRKTNALNEDLLTNDYFVEQTLSTDSERIPERIVHAKGAGAFGYFELQNDLSKYTKADLFRGKPGKKTPLACRFSLVVQNTGGIDAVRETRGMAIKYYTKEGNLDLIGLHLPVYFYRDPIDFGSFARSFKRNPSSNLIDLTTRYDFITLRPNALHAFMYLLSDFGIPKGYRNMDAFVQHALEFYNEDGERYYVRVNYRTDQGLSNFTSAEAAEVTGRDQDYSVRDLYNAIARKDYPTWTVELFILSEHDIKKINFDPFDLTRLWPEGTYKTVVAGRIVLDKNPENYFAQVEQAAYNPVHLVPGINGSPDAIYRARRLAYRDSARNRVGINFNNIEVNRPKYLKVYNRDGKPPVGDNMGSSPNYYPNSFHGPEPYVDKGTPRRKLVIHESNAVDLLPSHDFYNRILKSEGEKQRLADTIGVSLVTVSPVVQKRALELYSLVDRNLGYRAERALEVAKREAQARAAREAAAERADKRAAAIQKWEREQKKAREYSADEEYQRE